MELQKKQNTTSRSSCELEYRALSNCTYKVVWIRRLLSELRLLPTGPTPIGVDNQSAIKLTCNPVFYDRIKHFEVDLHFSRQKVEIGEIIVDYVSTNEQPADILTKALGKTKFEEGRDMLKLKTLEVVFDFTTRNQ